VKITSIKRRNKWGEPFVKKKVDVSGNWRNIKITFIKRRNKWNI